MTINEITEAIIGAAIEVHRALVLGLLESATGSAYNRRGAETQSLPARSRRVTEQTTAKTQSWR